MYLEIIPQFFFFFLICIVMENISLNIVQSDAKAIHDFFFFLIFMSKDFWEYWKTFGDFREIFGVISSFLSILETFLMVLREIFRWYWVIFRRHDIDNIKKKISDLDQNTWRILHLSVYIYANKNLIILIIFFLFFFATHTVYIYTLYKFHNTYFSANLCSYDVQRFMY